MQLVRSFAVLIFGLSALAAFVLAYATYPDKTSGDPGAFMFKWSDAVSRCGEAAKDCHPDAIIRAAGSQPLSPRPFALKLANATAESHVVAERLFLRDPRSSFARLTLAEMALKRARFDEFLDVFLPLFGIERSSAPVYADILAQLSDDREFRDVIVGKLNAERPYWGAVYISSLTKSVPVPLDELIELHKYYPRAQQSFVRRLIAAKQYDIAYLAFIEFLSGGYLETDAPPMALTVPFNPGLLDYPAPAPFDWALHSRGAEFLQGGGVYSFYQGRKSETFLSQTFPLGAGSHTFDIRQSGQASETSGYFKWELSCADKKKLIASLDVKTLSAAPDNYVFNVNLEPGDCAFATLSLKGISGSFPQPARIEVSSVQLVGNNEGAGAGR